MNQFCPQVPKNSSELNDLSTALKPSSVAAEKDNDAAAIDGAGEFKIDQLSAYKAALAISRSIFTTDSIKDSASEANVSSGGFGGMAIPTTSVSPSELTKAANAANAPTKTAIDGLIDGLLKPYSK